MSIDVDPIGYETTYWDTSPTQETTSSSTSGCWNATFSDGRSREVTIDDEEDALDRLIEKIFDSAIEGTITITITFKWNEPNPS